MEDRGGNQVVIEMIRAATFAGAYGLLARRQPESARGLEKMRVKWSERVGALADEMHAGMALAGLPRSE